MTSNMNFDHELLTQEDEVRLFNDLDNPESRDTLVNSNLRLVASIANRFSNRGVPIEDLIQEGVLGLLVAIDKFDVTKGFKFSTYATWWVISAVERCVTSSKSIKLPVHVKDHIDRIYKASLKLEKKLNREPTTDEVADAINLEDSSLSDIIEVLGTYADIVEKCFSRDMDAYTELNEILSKKFKKLSNFQTSAAVRAYVRVAKQGREVTPDELSRITNIDVETINRIMILNQTISLDVQIGDARADTMAEVITDTIDSAEDTFMENEDTSIMIKCLSESNIPERDVELVVSRYGLLDGRPKTLTEVGDEFDISKERARQIESRVLSNPAFILALHKNGVVDGEKVKTIINNKRPSNVKREAFDAEKVIEEMKLAKLNAKEEKVLTMRFNLKGDNCKTLQQISDTIGLSIQRVRQIETRALQKGSILETVYAQNLIKPSKYQRIKNL